MPEISSDEKKPVFRKQENHKKSENQPAPAPGKGEAFHTLQQQVGNRAVQRMLAQRSGDGPFDLDGETADRINRERSGGQPLDSAMQARMGQATGHDFGDVKVHTSPESAELSQQVGAVAFTTGKDIFFNQGAYNPQSSNGQELLAHELTHVVQQSTGAPGSAGSGMTVNAPGDAYEQEAEAVSKAVTSNTAGPEIQRAALEDEDDLEQIHRQELDDDDEELAQKGKL